MENENIRTILSGIQAYMFACLLRMSAKKASGSVETTKKKLLLNYIQDKT